MLELGSKPEDKLKQYWFCSKCRGILRPYQGLSGSGKFIVPRKNPEFALKNAISSRKISSHDVNRVYEIAGKYFQIVNLNQVQLQGVFCPNCDRLSVTLTLSYKFDDFNKKTQFFNLTDQVRLFNSWFQQGMSKFCPQCGQRLEGLEKFCFKCGSLIPH